MKDWNKEGRELDFKYFRGLGANIARMGLIRSILSILVPRIEQLIGFAHSILVCFMEESSILSIFVAWAQILPGWASEALKKGKMSETQCFRRFLAWARIWREWASGARF